MFAGRLLALSSATISGASPALIARGACANHSTCERHCLPMIRISHLGLPTAHRRARRRSDSIYSKRPEEPKTGWRREPTEPLALSSSEQLHKRPSQPLSGRADRYNGGFFVKQKKELTTLAVRNIAQAIEKVVKNSYTSGRQL
jgi:hypothetical protein